MHSEYPRIDCKVNVSFLSEAQFFSMVQRARPPAAGCVCMDSPAGRGDNRA